MSEIEEYDGKKAKFIEEFKKHHPNENAEIFGDPQKIEDYIRFMLDWEFTVGDILDKLNITTMCCRVNIMTNEEIYNYM